VNLIPTKVTAKVMLTVLKTKKHSPKIMFAAGVVGVVTTVVTASRATLKGADILENHKLTKAGLEGIPFGVEYTKDDLVKDKALLITQTSLKLAKVYAPSVIIGVASIGLLTGAHVALTRRNAALTAALAAVDRAFNEYRGRVRESVGEERERELYRDVREEKITVTDANGKQKQVVAKVGHGGGKYTALYGPITPEGFPNPNWQELPEMNVLALRGIQRQMNDKLQINGFVFLNEVLNELDLPRTKMGQAVGWLKRSADGDGFIDFGIFEDKDADRLFKFASGREDEIWLDFNCQGDILDRI